MVIYASNVFEEIVAYWQSFVFLEFLEKELAQKSVLGAAFVYGHG